MSSIPAPQSIQFSELYRDGKSYCLDYRTKDNDLIGVFLESKLGGGYQQPTIQKWDLVLKKPGPDRVLAWEEAIELAGQLEPLLGQQIRGSGRGGGEEPAREMLRILRLKGDSKAMVSMGWKLQLALFLPSVVVLLSTIYTFLWEWAEDRPDHPGTWAWVLWGGAVLASPIAFAAVPLARQHMRRYSALRTKLNHLLVGIGLLPILYAAFIVLVIGMSFEHGMP